MPYRYPMTQKLLAALPVFEAAARHGSFTHAGEELGLSQPTVSHHIRRLEEELTSPLFIRQHNRLKLTRQGEQLAAAITLGFGHMEQELRQQAERRPTGGVTLACSFGFANGWLLPRFSSLRRVLGDARIDLATTDWLSGYDRDQADLLISWAGDTKSDHERIALFPEVVSPVCSPDFLARHPQLSGEFSTEHLLSHPLLHFDERDSQFMNWQKWFARRGVDYSIPGDCYMFANYEFLLQAVMEGDGIGIGWDHLLGELLETRKLVRIAQPMRGEKTAYFLEIRRGRAPDALLDKVAAWFRAEGDHPI